MGVAYNIISAGAVHQYPFAVQSLRSFGMAPPPPSDPSRNPSPQELRAVLDELAGYTTSYSVSPVNWQASVEAADGFRLFRREILISVVSYSGHEAAPHLFYFEGDPRLNILLIERLSRLCGPLFVFPDTGARPLLVTPGVDPTDAIKAWESKWAIDLRCLTFELGSPVTWWRANDRVYRRTEGTGLANLHHDQRWDRDPVPYRGVSPSRNSLL